jgi:hypothetical protein
MKRPSGHWPGSQHHWRSDYQQSLLLGEAVAIAFLQDIVHLFNEPGGYFTFTSFGGKTITTKG